MIFFFKFTLKFDLLDSSQTLSLPTEQLAAVNLRTRLFLIMIYIKQGKLYCQ
jgi:hypothetical protein